MSVLQPTGEQVLNDSAVDPALSEHPWRLDWRSHAATARRPGPPGHVDHHTSGSTGEQRRWRRTHDQLVSETDLLAQLVAIGAPQAVVAFAPPRHLYGYLATALLPARLGVPVWFRPNVFGVLPDTGVGRVLVVATPWVLRLLLESRDWADRFEHLTVLHSSALLPATAGRLLAERGPGRCTLVDVLGSTETGAVAARRWSGGEPPDWTLLPDVELMAPGGGAASGGQIDVPLVICSPRLAAGPDGGPPPQSWDTGDLVRLRGDRDFTLVGRTSRLVKVNGRRVDLDAAEARLADGLGASDLALVPVRHDVAGEAVELLLVLPEDRRVDDLDLAAGFRRCGLRPRRVHVVDAIERTELGKLRSGAVAALMPIRRTR